MTPTALPDFTVAGPCEVLGSPDDVHPNEALLGNTFRTATINLKDLYLLSDRFQTTQRDQERMSWAFIFFLIGATVVANAPRLV